MTGAGFNDEPKILAGFEPFFQQNIAHGLSIGDHISAFFGTRIHPDFDFGFV